MSRQPTRTELLRVIVTLPSTAKCVYCGDGFGKTGTQTMDDVMRSITQHKATCPRWPTPRSRTAQCRPMAGQTAIPLPG
jgi:hypothetical protein